VASGWPCFRQNSAVDPLSQSKPFMQDEAEDQSVLNVIQRLAAEEHRLYEHEALTDADRERLTKINIDLDQCWDLLRQRQALRDAGRNPDEAHVRSHEIVENCEQ
jgi:hypothetical protein